MESQDTTKVPTGLVLYSRASHAAAKEVIYSYSTSFGLATRLLDRRYKEHVENIYAMVRVADEIVDGSAAEAQRAEKAVSPEKMLSEFESETYRAMELGYSTNLILHAFAQTARLVGIKKDIVEPFFASMRMDLTEKEHDPESFAAYVYGSAEVVGLMCLAVFVHERSYTAQEKKTLVSGARALGAAFQKVNFLRDLAADFDRLGRSYFPNVSVENFDEDTKRRLVEDIQKDLETSSMSLPLLPMGARRAVAAAQLLFQELNQKISKTPAQELKTRRISVGNTRKLVLVARALRGVA